MGNGLFATKPVETLLREAGETGEHSLKRALGPINLVTLGIGAIIGALACWNSGVARGCAPTRSRTTRASAGSLKTSRSSRP
jgi:hypothetical protein